ncbi:Crp/Fnr family transcriptional regulator [Sphingomonas paeninsulae]|jgi:hypothetical protein|nr:Crp/Fnr family transcriptional regulator [Sphingomonas paeninsulae]
MNGVDLATTIAALRAISPFSLLGAGEILLIAEQARQRKFAAGHMLIPAGSVAATLFVAIDGVAETTIGPVGAVFDVPGLLFGLGARADVRAGAGGLTALVIAKPHVFTIARECPEFIVGLLDAPSGDRE